MCMRERVYDFHLDPVYLPAACKIGGEKLFNFFRFNNGHQLLERGFFHLIPIIPELFWMKVTGYEAKSIHVVGLGMA